MSDLGGKFTGGVYPASGYVAGANAKPIATPVFTYYLATDTKRLHPLSGAPSAPGSYYVLATFAGNADYLPTSTTAPFVITIPVTSFAASAISFSAGKSFSGTVATFSAPSTLPVSDYTVTINWGDGTTSAGKVAAGATKGQFKITGSHTWSKAGNYTVTITLTPVATTPLTATGTAASVTKLALIANFVTGVFG
jgi:hypothetical protein